MASSRPRPALSGAPSRWAEPSRSLVEVKSQIMHDIRRGQTDGHYCTGQRPADASVAGDAPADLSAVVETKEETGGHPGNEFHYFAFSVTGFPANRQQHRLGAVVPGVEILSGLGFDVHLFTISVLRLSDKCFGSRDS